MIKLCFVLKRDLSTSLKIDSNDCFGRAKLFLILYRIVFNIYIMITPLPFLLDRIQRSWLYPGMFNISLFVLVAQVSHKPINVNDMSKLSK